MWNTDNTKSWGECGATEELPFTAVGNAASVELSLLVSYNTNIILAICQLCSLVLTQRR